ncbi:MAG: helix-turn-helix domain-containing protein [Gammaproteobacteria bacterium]|nr:helix-turn-helix domain-containing protein [Gammaproteobacteria bacterium]
MAQRTPRFLIAVVAFHRVIPFHLAVPCIVFGEAVFGDNPFEVVVCAGEPGEIETTTGFGLTNLASLNVLKRADAVVIPGWRDSLDAPPKRLLEALRAAHRRGADIVGLCLGTHVLAAAGLLDGRRATTHWECATMMAERHPGVEIDPEVLYVEDGGVLTSAGTAASIDACLHLLRQRLGATAANRAARRLVVAPHRDGGQAQFIEQPLPKAAGDTRLARLTDEVRERLDEPHTLDTLADEARMSRRSFTRHFKALTGTTVKAWLLKERLALTQRLLESCASPIESIAETAGFGSVVSLRQHFREAFGISPTMWRARFQSPDTARKRPRRTTTGVR